MDTVDTTPFEPSSGKGLSRIHPSIHLKFLGYGGYRVILHPYPKYPNGWILGCCKFTQFTP